MACPVFLNWLWDNMTHTEFYSLPALILVIQQV